MGLFDTISGYLNGATKDDKAKEANKVTNDKDTKNIINIDSSTIEDYTKYLESNDIYISYEMQERLNNLSKRANEPMKLAVSGLFSSGKSTFLNAMLSDDILPSGNLPITSKITYLRYGKEPQLKLTYNDGREELASVDNIEKYVNQQSAEQIKSINHITLYYPKEILKNIVFVDTPGFNSPNKMDDETTEDILKNVDGIIWLTMISNAGKKSEIDILEKYFKQYNQKSICIVNHKDEIDDEDEVAEFIDELKEDTNFSKFFTDTIPISAKQALESRQKDQNQLMLKLVRDFSNSIEDKLISHIGDETINQGYEGIMKDDLGDFLRKHNQIKNSDKDENKALLEESNIIKVFSYIESGIMPQANQALSFSLQKEMESINSKIGEHYQYLSDAIDELESILEEFTSYQNIAIDELNGIMKKHSTKILRDIENILAVVTDIIYNSFTLVKNGEFFPDGETTFWNDTPTGDFVDVYMFDNEHIWNELANENGQFQVATSKLDNSLDKMNQIVIEKLDEIENVLENDMNKWKDKYSTLQEISQENILLQEFAFRSFDLFVNDVENKAIVSMKDLEMYSELISSNYTHFMNMVNASFRVAFYFERSDKKPKNKDINNLLNEVTNIQHTQDIITGKDSIFVALLENMQEVLSEISKEKTKDILPHKKDWKNKNKLLNEYIKQLEKRL